MISSCACVCANVNKSQNSKRIFPIYFADYLDSLTLLFAHLSAAVYLSASTVSVIVEKHERDDRFLSNITCLFIPGVNN